MLLSANLHCLLKQSRTFGLGRNSSRTLKHAKLLFITLRPSTNLSARAQMSPQDNEGNRPIRIEGSTKVVSTEQLLHQVPSLPFTARFP